MQKFFTKKGVRGNIEHYRSGKYNMEYVHAGDSTKPMVLFVHGSPGSLSAFLGYVVDSTLLKHGFIISADRPGFGHSNFGSAEPSIEHQAAILKTIIERHSGARPVVLVGHSLGGPVIARMAMDYPHLVNALVVISGSMDPELEPNEKWFRAPLATPFLRWLLPRSIRASNDELYRLKPQLEGMLPEWRKITCPVVVIHGKNDSLVPFGNVAFLKKVLAETPTQFLIDDKAGHFIPWQNHEMVVTGILLALQSTPRSH